MIKRMLLAVALMASALTGFTAVQTVTAPVAGATCSGPNSIDWGWHDGQSVIHMVGDFYYNQTTCKYVTHYVADCFPRTGGTITACYEGWLDEWNTIVAIYDGTHFSTGWTNGSVTMSTPNSADAGVALMDDNSNAAWCQLDWTGPSHTATLCARSWSGSEWHNTSYIHWQQWAASSGYGARVDLLF